MSPPTPSPTTTSIHSATTLGRVALTVSDLAARGVLRAGDRSARDRARRRRRSRSASPTSSAGRVAWRQLRAGAQPPRHRPLPPRDPRCPTRRDLAFALARLAEARWPLDGASDHLVSEALYLSDPDGNGIEIYRDRPRDSGATRRPAPDGHAAAGPRRPARRAAGGDDVQRRRARRAPDRPRPPPGRRHRRRRGASTTACSASR